MELVPPLGFSRSACPSWGYCHTVAILLLLLSSWPSQITAGWQRGRATCESAAGCRPYEPIWQCVAGRGLSYIPPVSTGMLLGVALMAVARAILPNGIPPKFQLLAPPISFPHPLCPRPLHPHSLPPRLTSPHRLWWPKHPQQYLRRCPWPGLVRHPGVGQLRLHQRGRIAGLRTGAWISSELIDAYFTSGRSLVGRT